MAWTVYKISFSDKAEYVGYTKKCVYKRLAVHRTNPANLELHHRLQNEIPCLEILHENLKSHLEAYRLEKLEIQRLTLPINRIGLLSRQDTNNSNYKITRASHEIREGEYRCCKCRDKKQHTEFSRDRSRYNGLKACCKKCDREAARQRREEQLWKRTEISISQEGDIGVKHKKTTIPGIYKCYNCYRHKQHTEFYKDRGRKSGIGTACKECVRLIARRRRNQKNE